MSEEHRGTSGISSFRVLMALGGAAIWLVLAGVVGAIHVASTDSSAATSAAGSGQGAEPGAPGPGEGTTPVTDPSSGEVIAIDPNTGQPFTVDSTGDGPAGTTGGTGGTGGTNPPPPTPGNRTGVSATEIKIGIHAPKTIGGAPLNLAEDPLKGIEGYTKFINDNGGINGRKLVLDIQDDRYETSGGKAAGIRLIERGNFILSGTLGVDQINAVAIEANKAAVPYHAAGGHEPDFARLGLYQLATSYDTHVIQLARWMVNDPTTKGKKVGITVLDSPLLLPVVDLFKAEAQRVGVSVVEVVKIKKPTEQASYSAQIQKLKDAGTQVVVPMQDPISTSRIVQECTAALCGWTYAFSDFAHEGDAALALFGGKWGSLKVRGLAAGCYYQHENADNPAFCAHMDRAHAQWVQVYGQNDWVSNGGGGSAGYQIVQMLAEAIRRAGPDLTRERYRAAIQSYSAFDDLVTSPITFAGKSSYAHGSEKMVVFEAQSNNKYRQITPGLAEF